jgi:hypothetical protein
MVIRKGEPWGTTVARPAELVVVGSDRELARWLMEHREVPVAVSAGDVHRTLGAPTAASGGVAPEVRRVPMDVLRCELDGVELLAVAHVVARHGGPTGWWRGPVHAVCNAQFIGRWDVAPSGHPNDGRAEVVEVRPDMPARQRHGAWRRLPTGRHVPHPSIRSAHGSSAHWEFERPLDVYVDGRRHRRVRSLRVTVEPDAYELHV